MRTGKVVVPEPRRELLVSFFRRCVMAGVGPFAQGRLDEAPRLAVGAWRLGSGEVVVDSELRAIGVAVAGEQATDRDAVLRIKSNRCL
jgi:hypothetical protein